YRSVVGIRSSWAERSSRLYARGCRTMRPSAGLHRVRAPLADHEHGRVAASRRGGRHDGRIDDPRPPRPGSVDRLQVPHDLLAMRLEEGWEHHLLAEGLHILVHREPGPIGGDLEQDSVRLAEVEAAEPVAIDLPAVGN